MEKSAKNQKNEVIKGITMVKNANKIAGTVINEMIGTAHKLAIKEDRLMP